MALKDLFTIGKHPHTLSVKYLGIILKECVGANEERHGSLW